MFFLFSFQFLNIINNREITGTYRIQCSISKGRWIQRFSSSVCFNSIHFIHIPYHIIIISVFRLQGRTSYKLVVVFQTTFYHSRWNTIWMKTCGFLQMISRTFVYNMIWNGVYSMNNNIDLELSWKFGWILFIFSFNEDGGAASVRSLNQAIYAT